MSRVVRITPKTPIFLLPGPANSAQKAHVPHTWDACGHIPLDAELFLLCPFRALWYATQGMVPD